jgi:LacI family transcriptional regulator, kdg operon repressor
MGPISERPIQSTWRASMQKKSKPEATRRAALDAGHVTIADVARDAGISKTTVSRYLGGEIALLAEATRAQIEGSIARLGYQPNQMARALKRGRTRLIGMVVADVLNPYSIAVLNGAEAACQQYGYTLMLCNTANDEQRERHSLAALRSYSVEGLLVHTQGRSVPELQQLAAGPMPVVLIDRKLAGLQVDLVGLDNHHAARAATLHLMERGFTDIAFVTEPLRGVSSRQEREASFRVTLAENPDCDGSTIEIDARQPALLEQALARFRSARAQERKALLAASGVVTLHVVSALHRLGLELPRDVGLVGFDELDWSPLVGPGITTLAQPTYDIGFRAVETLLGRLGGDRSAPRQILLQGTLCPRGSTLDSGRK